ncbi:hypothetical protein I3760_Q005100 [Carya illinoinensis]|nr:hypothetical protein I3760_Q005100 [Carya illinoinensis]
MKAILLIICLLLASSVLFVPSSVLARELKVEQADASYRGKSIKPPPSPYGRCMKYKTCLPKRPPPPPRRCPPFKPNCRRPP